MWRDSSETEGMVSGQGVVEGRVKKEWFYRRVRIAGGVRIRSGRGVTGRIVKASRQKGMDT